MIKSLHAAPAPPTHRMIVPRPERKPVQRYYFHEGDETYGPLLPCDLQILLKEGRISESTLLCREEGGDWFELRQLPEFAVIVHLARLRARGPEPSHAPCRIEVRLQPVGITEGGD